MRKQGVLERLEGSERVFSTNISTSFFTRKLLVRVENSQNSYSSLRFFTFSWVCFSICPTLNSAGASFTDRIYFAAKTLKRASTSLPVSFERKLFHYSRGICINETSKSAATEPKCSTSQCSSAPPSPENHCAKPGAGCWVVCSGAPQSKTLRGIEQATTPWAAPKPSTWSNQASNLSTESN